MTLPASSCSSTFQLQLGRDITVHLPTVLYRFWAIVALGALALPEIQAGLASKHWLLILVLAVSVSLLLAGLWYQKADSMQLQQAKPWILHWASVLAVCGLFLQTLARPEIELQWVLQQLLLLLALAFLVGGLHLHRRLLGLGLALVLVYAYHLGVGYMAGIIGGLVVAAGLWACSLPPGE